MTIDKVSVIIITYNVSRFITFCIDSIIRSDTNSELEIIIVDNNSTDDTVDILKSAYNKLIIISNNENGGFSKACNQGAAVANGQYLLFLNPDCIISESAIEKMSGHLQLEKVGMVGPMLLDGGGKYLPESAREIPTTKSAIAKILRLPFQKSFPYYRTVSDQSAVDAPVLSGACMMVRKDLYNDVDGFDERFFMYGEDVDLSVRIIQKGLRNRFVPEAKVIHFKGESTDRASFGANEHFYKAITIYNEKHHSNKVESIKTHSLNFASGLLSVVRYTKELMSRMLPAVGDMVLIFMTIWGLQFIWSYFKIGHFDFYENYRYLVYYLLYSLVWIIALTLGGSYFNNSQTPQRHFKGALLGSVLVITIYSLLPIDLRFSRGIIGLSVLVIPLVMLLRFWIKTKVIKTQFILVTNELGKDPVRRVFDKRIDRAVSSNPEIETNRNSTYIFDFNNLKCYSIITFMLSITGNSNFEFWDSKRGYLFSSSTKSNRGVGVNMISNYNLSQDVFQLHKRLFDIAVILLFLLPIFIIKILIGKWNFDKLKRVLSGSNTIVGYKNELGTKASLPTLPESLLLCYHEELDLESMKGIAHTYASKYTIFDDAFIVITNFLKFIKVLID